MVIRTPAVSVGVAYGCGTRRRPAAKFLSARNWLLLPLIFICLPVHADWTFMVYLDADNDLESSTQ